MKFLHFLIAIFIFKFTGARRAILFSDRAISVGLRLSQDILLNNATLDDLDKIFLFPLPMSRCKSDKTFHVSKNVLFERLYKNRHSSIPSEIIEQNFAYRHTGYSKTRYLDKAEDWVEYISMIESDRLNFKMTKKTDHIILETEVVRAVGNGGVESYYVKSMKICKVF
ncbi:unnamed protein product [Caenorhabditis angaria]|uniref:Uncharacterized protein n=1 Tax=Caenorhabditis angaria TaxID=860376 RepID=A0A9P1N0X3_9PELO|nr:unnamed protein product [Caenorhabditis angaria]